MLQKIFKQNPRAQIFLGTNSKTNLTDVNSNFIYPATPAAIHRIHTKTVAPESDRRFIEAGRHQEFLAGEADLLHIRELYRPTGIMVSEQIGNFLQEFTRLTLAKKDHQPISA